MRLDAVTVALRRRSTWESADLGAVLVRAWGRQLAPLWLAAYLAPALLATVVLPLPVVAAAVAWWCRPLVERRAWAVMSRCFLGQPPGPHESWRLARPSFGHGTLSLLTIRRLMPSRQFACAVWDLEGLKGTAARARIRLLARTVTGPLCYIAGLGLVAVATLTLTLLELMAVMRPEAALPVADDPFGVLTPRGAAMAFVCADAGVAALLSAVSFSAYINRRSALEAWDVELAFRRLARRLATVAVVAPLLAVPATAHADAGDPTAEPRARIRDVLSGEDFGRDEIVQQWRLRDWGREDGPTERPAWLLGLLSWLGPAAGVVRIAMIVAAGGAVLWLVFVAVNRERGSPAPLLAPAITDGVIATSMTTDADSPSAIARRALEAGAVVDALAALYRGSLDAVARAGTAVRPGTTEGEYLALAVTQLPDAPRTYVRRLIQSWQAAAYAGRLPTPADVAALCDEWDALVDEARPS